MSQTLLKLGILSVAMALPLCAEINRSWEELMRRLQPGQTVVVVQHGRKQAEGKLVSLTPEAITVRMRGQPVAIPKDDVFRVRIANIRRKHTLLGMAIGAGAGAIIWTIAGRDNVNNGFYPVAGMIFGVGPGAAVGGSLPIGEPLYEAPGGLRRK